MTSEAWADIKRARKGKRGVSRLRNEDHPPHLRVISPAEGSEELLPALASAGAENLEDYFWIRHPQDPSRDSLSVYASADTDHADYIFTPKVDGTAATEVRTGNGKVVLTAVPNGSAFRTSWTVNVPNRSAMFTIVERKRDALWRRVFGPPTKLSNAGWDVIGFVMLIAFLPAMLKPPIRMQINDSDGANVGMVTFASGYIRPREDFCLYLNDELYPLRDPTLALAATAIVQGMR